MAYHDTEWGVPDYDDRALFEKLILDGFQAGLSWITILRKRDNFRKAFDGFEPAKIARYTRRRKSSADERRRHRAQPRQDRRHGAAARRLISTIDGERSGLLRNCCGIFPTASRRINKFKTTRSVPAETPTSRAGDVQGTGRSAASNSSGRPSSTPSCRRSAWSTTISSSCHCHERACTPSGRKNVHDGDGGRQKPRAWQRMLSGRRLDLLDPSPLDVEIEDIAHGLARVARWNGQTRGAHIFSVAQHTLLVEADLRGALDRGSTAGCGSRCCCTTHRNMSSAT